MHFAIVFSELYAQITTVTCFIITPMLRKLNICGIDLTHSREPFFRDPLLSIFFISSISPAKIAFS